MRYYLYSAGAHAVLLIFLFAGLSAAPPVYYGIDFVSHGSGGFGAPEAGGAPAPRSDAVKTAAPPPQKTLAPTSQNDKKVQLAEDKKKTKESKNLRLEKDGKVSRSAAAGKTKAQGVEDSNGTGGKGKGEAYGNGTGLEIGGVGPGGDGGAFGRRFPYPWYVNIIYKRLWQEWDRTNGEGKECIVMFTIARDGAVSGVSVKKSSGDSYYDIQARRAVEVASPFPPLPEGFTEPDLKIFVRFKLN